MFRIGLRITFKGLVQGKWFTLSWKYQPSKHLMTFLLLIKVTFPLAKEKKKNKGDVCVRVRVQGGVGGGGKKRKENKKKDSPNLRFLFFGTVL